MENMTVSRYARVKKGSEINNDASANEPLITPRVIVCFDKQPLLKYDNY